MRVDKIKKIEITLGVAYHSVEIVDLKQAQIAVIILDAFLLELGALFGRELVILIPRFGARGAKLMISEERFATMRPQTVGTSGQFHLQHAKIDPEMKFLAAIEPKNFAHFDRAILVWPILQNAIQIQAHPEQMIEHLRFNCQSSRADAGNALKNRGRRPGEVNHRFPDV